MNPLLKYAWHFAIASGIFGVVCGTLIVLVAGLEVLGLMVLAFAMPMLGIATGRMSVMPPVFLMCAMILVNAWLFAGGISLETASGLLSSLATMSVGWMLMSSERVRRWMGDVVNS